MNNLYNSVKFTSGVLQCQNITMLIEWVERYGINSYEFGRPMSYMV